MGCCGKNNQIPKISEKEQKLIEKVKKINYGSIKGGSSKVTLTTMRCFNCNTLSSRRAICRICGNKI